MDDGQKSKPDEIVTRTSGGTAPPKGGDEFDPGDQIGRFTVVGRLGQGGMGVVYSALDPELNRQVALKLVRFDRSQSQDQPRLLREAQAMARLSHPNVVAVHEVGTHRDLIFIAMEQVEGTTLKAWLRQAPRSWREILEVFRQAGRGLEAAHAAGFIHRDFKPDNVLIGKNGRVQVTDFGLARIVGSQELENVSASAGSGGSHDLLASSLTVEGAVVGTLAYMSPEQLRGEPLDVRADEFSFCVALFEALYGLRPYEREEVTLRRRPMPATRGVPRWLNRVLSRGLALDPAQRYPAMAELLLALEADPAVLRRRIAVSLGLLCAGALLVLGGLRLMRQPSPCEAPERALRGTWDDEVRDRLRRAFVASGAPQASERWQYTEKELDQKASRWLAIEKDVCAARAAHSEAESANQLRLECLARQQDDFQVVVDMLSVPSPALIESSVPVVQSLPAPLDCADARALPILDQLPPEKTAEVKRIRAEAVRAWAQSRMGSFSEAIAAHRTLAAQAESLGAFPLASQIEDYLAMEYSADAQHAQSLEAYRAELRLAEANRLDVAEALAYGGVVIELALGNVAREEVDRNIEALERAVERAHQAVRARRVAEFAIGSALNVLGEELQALPHLTQALELTRQSLGEDSLAQQIILNNLSAGYSNLGREEEAIATAREGIALANRVLGPGRGNVQLLWLNLGWALRDLGRYDEAREALQHGLRNPENLYSILGHSLIADCLAESGRAEEGKAEAEVTLAAARAFGDPDSIEITEVYRFCAVAMSAAGERSRAESLVHQLLQRVRRMPARSPDQVQYLAAAGHVMVENGKPATAIPLLDRALLLATRPVYPGLLAEVRFDLARALLTTKGDVARAKTLASQAEQELATLPPRQRTHAQVVAWQAKVRAR